jgi:hypothetical protein
VHLHHHAQPPLLLIHKLLEPVVRVGKSG